MPKRKRAREGRNVTQEKKARSGVTPYHGGDSFEFQVTAVRTQCMLETKDFKGSAHMVYKHWLGGPAMEEILRGDNPSAIAAGLIEALKNGMRIEADAQAVLVAAEPRMRRAIAQAFEAEAKELALSCNLYDGRLANFLAATVRRLSPKTKPEPERRLREQPKTETLEAVLDRTLALGDVKAAAKAIAEAELVDGELQDSLKRLPPELARELAINLKRRARKLAGQRARFLIALAKNIEPAALSQPALSKPEKRRAA